VASHRTAPLVEAVAHTQIPGVVLEVAPMRGDTGEDAWMPSLLKLSRRHGWPSHAQVETSKLTADDVLVSVRSDRIVDCGAPHWRGHTIFTSLPPRYRGSLMSALSVHHDERETAVSLHDGRGRPIGSSYTVEFGGSTPAPGTVVNDSPNLGLVACVDALLALEIVSEA
jgi:hypothetical protein